MINYDCSRRDILSDPGCWTIPITNVTSILLKVHTTTVCQQIPCNFIAFMSIESTTAIITQHLWLWHLDSPAPPVLVAQLPTVHNSLSCGRIYKLVQSHWTNIVSSYSASYVFNWHRHAIRIWKWIASGKVWLSTVEGKWIASSASTSYSLSGTAIPSSSFWEQIASGDVTSYSLSGAIMSCSFLEKQIASGDLTSYGLSGAIMSASLFGNWIASGDVTFCGLSGAVMPASLFVTILLLVILTSYKLSGAIMPATLFGFQLLPVLSGAILPSSFWELDYFQWFDFLQFEWHHHVMHIWGKEDCFRWFNFLQFEWHRHAFLMFGIRLLPVLKLPVGWLVQQSDFLQNWMVPSCQLHFWN